MSEIYTATPEFLRELKTRANNMRKSIMGTPDTHYTSENTFYVSPHGNDANDGRSPHKAWLTCQNLTSDEITAGSVVCFERGGTYRGGFTAKAGVTYSAYGKGAKPRIFGSPYNGASYGTWTLTDAPDVYVYSERIKTDVGGLFFDGGKSNAVKLIPSYNEGKPYFDRTFREEFTSYRDIKRDLTFFHDFGAPVVTSDDGGLLYLCSKEGNPAERFSEIEFNIRQNIIRIGGHGVTIDNLAIMYGGAHGIGAGTVNDLTVKNCFIGYIGGGIQFYHKDGAVTRFGNGIEIYGGCRDFTIENCYVNECYDAGITHQLSSGGENDVCHDNVVFKNNLIENCVYGIEYFLGKSANGAKRVMTDIFYTDNFIRNSGYGWGNERPDSDCQAAIKGWDHRNEAYNFIIENNILERSSWNLVHNGCEKDEWGPVYKNNTFIAERNGGLARYGANPSKQYLFNTCTASCDLFCDNTFVYLNKIDREPERYELKRKADTYQPV
jgi:hypothetical protein